MKLCPKCGNTHDKPGTFCSRSCANSRGPRTQEFKDKVSAKLTGRPSPQKGNIKVRVCIGCNKEFKTSRKQSYCTKECYNMTIRSSLAAFHAYRLSCRFNFNVYDYPEHFDLSLIERFGMYSVSNRGGNLDGISRDHMVSVRYGFDNDISPEIISHPANCELLTQRDNSAKRTKCSITIDELLERIECWTGR